MSYMEIYQISPYQTKAYNRKNEMLPSCTNEMLFRKNEMLPSSTAHINK